MAYNQLYQSESAEKSSCKESSPKTKNTLPSYTSMIAQAILSKSSQRSALSEIYEFMERHFPSLSEKGNGWRNCVRHTLSLSDCFMKLHRPENGRSCHWAIHPTYLPRFLRGDFRKKRQSRTRRSTEQTAPQEQYSFPGLYGREDAQYDNRLMHLSGPQPHSSVEPVDHSGHYRLPASTAMMPSYQNFSHVSQLPYGGSYMGNQQSTSQQNFYQNQYTRDYKTMNNFYDPFSQNYRGYYQ